MFDGQGHGTEYFPKDTLKIKSISIFFFSAPKPLFELMGAYCFLVQEKELPYGT